MNYFNKQPSYIFMKILNLSKLIRNDKTLKDYTSPQISLFYRFLMVFQTMTKTIITSQSQIESQIMQTVIKHTQTLSSK
jgi:hypothetical protein